MEIKENISILHNNITNTTFLASELDEQVQSGTRENDKHIEWMGDLDFPVIPTLIGRKVLMKYSFPLDNEIFEIVGETKDEIKIRGDFSAVYNYMQEDWDKKENISEFIYPH